MTEKVVTGQERISIQLRALYQKYGYLPYKMSKFEEYDLYVRNKEFLLGEGVITFNDTDGRLLALKPDVTLSIIKNDLDDGEKRKVYYDERVYRISPKTKQFKELRQVGVECLGEIGVYDVYETVCLALESLQSISTNALLSLSHLGVVSAIIKEMQGGEGFVAEALSALGDKKLHEGVALCQKYGVKAGSEEKLRTLFSAYGDVEETLNKVQPLCQSEESKLAFTRLQVLCALLKTHPCADKIRLDFSVSGDMHYYDDVVFKGFVQGVGESVLSGGRYDKLLARMGRKSGAIGFAVELDALEGFNEEKTAVDVDVLVTYTDGVPAEKVAKEVQKWIAEGKSVRAQTSDYGVRAGRIVALE